MFVILKLLTTRKLDFHNTLDASDWDHTTTLERLWGLRSWKDDDGMHRW